MRFDRSKKLGEKEKEEEEEIPISRDIFLLDARLQTLSWGNMTIVYSPLGHLQQSYWSMSRINLSYLGQFHFNTSPFLLPLVQFWCSWYGLVLIGPSTAVICFLFLGFLCSIISGPIKWRSYCSQCQLFSFQRVFSVAKWLLVGAFQKVPKKLCSYLATTVSSLSRYKAFLHSILLFCFPGSVACTPLDSIYANQLQPPEARRVYRHKVSWSSARIRNLVA